MDYDARQVANCLLDISERSGGRLTHLSLQKLVYFSHGLAYPRFGEALIQNRIEAWKNGPVVRELYFAFSPYGEQPITGRATFLNFETKRQDEIEYLFPRPIHEHLEEIVRVYGPLPPWRLVAMTHEKGTPWERTISNALHHANVGMHIDEGIIREFFARHPSVRT